MLMSLLENLQQILGCEFISDLRFEPYYSKVIKLLTELNLNCYTLDDIISAKEYLNLS